MSAPREIPDTATLIDIMEAQRNKLGMSYRELSTGSGMAHGTYFAVVEYGSEPRVASVIAYLKKMGLKLYVGE